MVRLIPVTCLVTLLILLVIGTGCTSAPAPQAPEKGVTAEHTLAEITVSATPVPSASVPDSIAAQLASVKSTNPVWKEAYRIFQNMKKTEYVHTTSVDESEGIYKFDCLGFVDYTLSRASPVAYEAASHGYAKPAIAQYAGYFSRLDTRTPNAAGWTKVAHPIDLKPGDICLWLKPTTLDLGHMWIIAGEPKINPARTDEVLVRIFDSDGVHSDDSRAEKTYKYGLGTGVMGMMTDAKGDPTGLYWQGGNSTSPGEEDTTIVCGRLNT